MKKFIITTCIILCISILSALITYSLYLDLQSSYDTGVIEMVEKDEDGNNNYRVRLDSNRRIIVHKVSKELGDIGNFDYCKVKFHKGRYTIVEVSEKAYEE